MNTIAASALNKGTAEHVIPPSLILSSNTQEQNFTETIYHIKSNDDDEDSTELCNCSFDEEYTRIPLAEAEASETHCCRNCRTAREGGLDTRPCLYCGEQISLGRWPQHVRSCIDPTDAADETALGGDLGVTDSAISTQGVC